MIEFRDGLQALISKRPEDVISFKTNSKSQAQKIVWNTLAGIGSRWMPSSSSLQLPIVADTSPITSTAGLNSSTSRPRRIPDIAPALPVET